MIITIKNVNDSNVINRNDFKIRSMATLLNDPKHMQKFHPFLKEYPHTFSGRKNVSTDELNKTMEAISDKTQHEAILTRKMDGIAMLCAIGIKECLAS